MPDLRPDQARIFSIAVRVVGADAQQVEGFPRQSGGVTLGIGMQEGHEFPLIFVEADRRGLDVPAGAVQAEERGVQVLPEVEQRQLSAEGLLLKGVQTAALL